MSHIFAALKEFFARYAQVIKAAWAERKNFDTPERNQNELAFLPAHLELIETPVSPLSRWIMRTIIAFFCVALAWSIIGKLDIVAVAPGKTIVGSRTKIIQTSETAVVQRILVHDGQLVQKDDVLIELDATSTAADYAKAGDALLNARLTDLRLTALAESLNTQQNPIL